MHTETLIFAPIPAKSTVAERVTAINRLWSYFDVGSIISPQDRIALKTHFGDVNNTTHIAPEIIRSAVPVVMEAGAKPFLTETATLYPSPRSNAIDHLQLAYDHGFSFEAIGAPIIMADGLLGNAEIEVEIPGEIYQQVNIARDAVLADGLIVFSHPTGHIAAGIGACIKNLGMGLSSRKGKLQQHSSIKPYIDETQCESCCECLNWCPENAIVITADSARITPEICIGCGECIAVCNFNAVKFNYAVESADLQRRMAEYAMGAVMNKRDKCIYINVLTDMTSQCDCMSITQQPIISDVGILLGTDPVAIDQATLDLTREANTLDLGHMSFPELDPSVQITHAEKIGLGSRKYQLVTL